LPAEALVAKVSRATPLGAGADRQGRERNADTVMVWLKQVH
jgi:hypothetical protein